MNEEYRNGTQRPDTSHGDALRAMIFGIISCAAYTVPVLPIIFGHLAKKWSADILALSPARASTRNFATAAKITGMIGFIVGIFMICVYVIAFFVGILIGFGIIDWTIGYAF